jgi:hypothetical protein
MKTKKAECPLQTAIKQLERNFIDSKGVAAIKLCNASPDLLDACHCPELDKAHDKLSAVLEHPFSETKDIRAAAVSVCEALNSHYEKRRKAIARTTAR